MAITTDFDNKLWICTALKGVMTWDGKSLTTYEGKPIDIELPPTVELKVIETEPSVKGATAAAQYKPATMETGLKITVPPFINIGEILQIDTRTGQYLSRAK